MKKSLLYIVNFYGTPPLNYFEKYLKETDSASVTVMILPAVRSSKNRLLINSMIKDENDNKIPININIFFPFPYFFLFFIQYIINFFLFFILLSKAKQKHFDVVISETNFGSALGYLLKKIGKVDYSVFMNGDILPFSKDSKRCFYLPNNGLSTNIIIKGIDSFIIKIQYWLRKFGYKNDLIWYANRGVKNWDKKYGLVSGNYFISDTIMIDYKQYLTYASIKKQMNKICYFGRLDDYVGLDLIIKSLKLIKNSISDIALLVVGGNEITIEKFKKLANEENVLDYVHFYGYVPEMNKAYEILSHCALGLALYKPTKGNVSLIAQPAKPREYIKVGLPVLVSKGGPSLGKDLVKKGAGLECEFNEISVSEIIKEVLTNNILYEDLQSHVRKYAASLDYYKCFAKIWKKITNKISS